MLIKFNELWRKIKKSKLSIKTSNIYKTNKKLYHLFVWLIFLPQIAFYIGYFDYWAYLTDFLGWGYLKVSFIIDFIILVVSSIIAVKIALVNLKNTKKIGEAVIYFTLLSLLVINIFANFYVGGADQYGGLCDKEKFENCQDIVNNGNGIYYIDKTNVSPIQFGGTVYDRLPSEGKICSKYESYQENGQSFARCIESKITKSDLIPIDTRIDRASVFYFSAVTFLGGGYGEIFPVGFKRYIAVFEMFLGMFIFLTLLGSIVADILKRK